MKLRGSAVIPLSTLSLSYISSRELIVLIAILIQINGVMATKEQAPSYIRVACIGAGLAGIALGVQLKRWYNLDDIQLFERNDDLGGT